MALNRALRRARQWARLTTQLSVTALLASCAPPHAPPVLDAPRAVAVDGERIRVLALSPGVTATIVAPDRLDARRPVEVILYALPNGNSTAETMGRLMGDSVGWRYDIQHIGAQTRALRVRGLSQAVVVYLEAETKSWPAWRSRMGYARANRRLVELIEQVRVEVGRPTEQAVTLAGHSGGGSLMFGFIEAQDAIPDWISRIVFLDANYNFTAAHGDKLVAWLQRDARHVLGVLAYDDREITLDGKKVVSDSGGTWRATGRMIVHLGRTLTLIRDTLAGFERLRAPQVELLRHPNPENRILHTSMIGDMNGYMHALLVGRPSYAQGAPVLGPPRAYVPFIRAAPTLPEATPPAIPPRALGAPTGSAFIASVAGLPREAREAAVRRELMAGNIPVFLRTLRSVTVRAAGPDGVPHTVTYAVMPDYLAIGSDDDFVRMPMDPYTAQTFCDAFGFVLPTRKMVNDIWTAATVRVEPRPLVQDRDSARTFLQHHRLIEEQLAGQGRGALVAGMKKDVVVTNRLQERANRVAIYGWHYVRGEPIQPLYTGHVDWYVDYSHGIRPVRRWMQVDGTTRTYEAILNDPQLATLLSDEGVILAPRYER
ncbi:MAG: hypothetical protein P3B98_01925 [Gemmatimonadota bacterium]|nr:hypothetical protein [Gemmatimonadota bacterium]